jgi:predicted GNAT family acetyltransferase
VENESELTLTNNTERNRFEAHLGDKLAGYSSYDLQPDRVAFVHTVVRPEYEGQGIGSRLAKFAIDDVRDRGLRIKPVCPFIRAYLLRHPEYNEIVDFPKGQLAEN